MMFSLAASLPIIQQYACELIWISNLSGSLLVSASGCLSQCHPAKEWQLVQVSLKSLITTEDPAFDGGVNG